MKDVPAKSAARRKTRMSMDDPDHGVLVTIIDLGLARMDAHDGTAAGVHWTPFDEEVFEGEGDYQFDVYRMMRTHNGDAWAEFRPLTNVMVSLSHLRFNFIAHAHHSSSSCVQWLHYLVLKLMQS